MSSIDRLAKQIVAIDRRLTNLAATPSLGHSSIEDGAIDAYDDAGQLVMSVGTQFDGTHAAVSVSGPPPPTPTKPTILAGPLSLTVQWDGLFLDPDGAVDPLSFAPSDFSRVEVHVSTEPGFIPETSLTLRGTIETPRGADVVISPMQIQPYYIRLVARTLSGNLSDPSPEATGTPDSSFDQEALDAELAEVNERIGAVAEAAAGELDEAMAIVAGDLEELGQTINAAALAPITDERFDPDSLSVWPFINGAIPRGALSPGAVSGTDIADFSLVVRKFNTNRHQLY